MPAVYSIINPFTPKFLKCTLPSLNLDTIVANKDIGQKSTMKTANSVGPDEMAHNEPSHLILHCLQIYLFWPVGLKG